MKKYLLIAILFILISGSQALAATPTEKPATPSEDQDRIQKIKDLVASRVAELKLVDKRGLLGPVIESSTTQLIIQDRKKARRIVDIDDITKFEDSDNESFGISDVKKGEILSIVGLYNKDTKRLLARYIYTVSQTPVFFEGVITDKDTKNFQLTGVDSAGVKRIIDVVPSTKTFSFDRDQGQIKSGFSKIPIGTRVFAAGFMDKKIDNQLNASRIIFFPGLALSQGMKKNQTEKPSEKSSTPTIKGRPTPTTVQ